MQYSSYILRTVPSPHCTMHSCMYKLMKVFMMMRERAICPNFYCALASEQLKDHTVSGVVGTE